MYISKEYFKNVDDLPECTPLADSEQVFVKLYFSFDDFNKNVPSAEPKELQKD